MRLLAEEEGAEEEEEEECSFTALTLAFGEDDSLIVAIQLVCKMSRRWHER